MLNWTRDKKGRMSAPSADDSFVWLIEQRGGLVDSLLPRNSLAAQRENPWVAGLYAPTAKRLQALMGAKTEKEAMAEAEGCEKSLCAIADGIASCLHPGFAKDSDASALRRQDAGGHRS